MKSALKATRPKMSMKAGAATRAMKAPSKKAMKKKPMKKKKAMKRVSKLGKRHEVMSGKKEKTKTGLKKSGLMKSKSSGKIVSKRKSAIGKKAYSNIAQWVSACKLAREQLGLAGFVAIKKGTPFYEKAKELLPTVAPLVRRGSTKSLSEAPLVR